MSSKYAAAFAFAIKSTGRYAAPYPVDQTALNRAVFGPTNKLSKEVIGAVKVLVSFTAQFDWASVGDARMLTGNDIMKYAPVVDT